MAEQEKTHKIFRIKKKRSYYLERKSIEDSISKEGNKIGLEKVHLISESYFKVKSGDKIVNKVEMFKKW